MSIILTILFWLFIGLPFIFFAGFVLFWLFAGLLVAILSPFVWVAEKLFPPNSSGSQ